MATITVVLTPIDTKYPSRGVTYDHTEVTVSDGTGTFAKSLNGKETPPWTGVFTVADAAGTVVAQPQDSLGNPIGTAKTQTYDASLGSFPAVSSITVTIA